jgi:hypothetical protein
MLPIKRYILIQDIELQTQSDASNFKYELPYSLTMPHDTVFFITDICIPHVFRLIEQDVNDRLYYTYYCNMSGQGTNIFAFYNLSLYLLVAILGLI